MQLEIRFFVFYLMDFCKWRGGGEGPVMVHLRGLCEFPVRRLDFGPYPSVCVCVYSCSCCSVAVGPPPPS